MLWCSRCKPRTSCYNCVDLSGVIPVIPVGTPGAVWYLYSVKPASSHWFKSFQGLEAVKLLIFFPLLYWLLCHLPAVTFSPRLLTLSLLPLWSPSLSRCSLWCVCIATVLGNSSQVAPFLSKFSLLYSPTSILLCNSPPANVVGLHREISWCWIIWSSLVTEKSPSKRQLSRALSFSDLAAGGACWVESWCWHVLSLLEKSRLSSYLAQTKLLHLMWMGSRHSGWK